MTQINEVYKCNVCGNIVEVVHEGAGELVCCGQPMQLMKENTVDASKEKHVPVVEKVEGGFLVKIGSEPHPMTPEHYIEWIELMKGDEVVVRKMLKPGDAPEFKFCCRAEKVTARAYCNLHGLWKN
ncbi:desulfoferrodoxin, partial [Candidatus Woesearchaeota archaeon]|nr:desulfoferrodoxin [Candidatus Woesearchaeota archaeon]